MIQSACNSLIPQPFDRKLRDGKISRCHTRCYIRLRKNEVATTGFAAFYEERVSLQAGRY